MSEQVRCLLAVVAHPDDETFGCGGTLAKYAHEGVRVVLICATRGEVGEISDPSLATEDKLGAVREQELREAAEVLGVSELIFLDYRDSGMAGTPDNEHSDAFSGANFETVVGEVVKQIRRLRPQVIITFDENGGYGHPDHIMANKVASESFAAAGNPSRFADQIGDGLAAHKPTRLYYFGFTRSMVTEFREAMREAGVASDIESIDPDQFGIPDERITTVLDVGKYAPEKEQAAAKHRTQIEGDDPFAWLPERLKQGFLSTEYLVRVYPESGSEQESDIFDGL